MILNWILAQREKNSSYKNQWMTVGKMEMLGNIREF